MKNELDLGTSLDQVTKWMPKVGISYRDHNRRLLTVQRVSADTVEYVRHGEQVSRICPLDWFIAEKYKSD